MNSPLRPTAFDEAAPARVPSDAEARAALDVLRRLVRTGPEAASALGLSNLPAVRAGDGALSRRYPAEFRVDAAYRDSLPDLQNGPASLIKGARRNIQHVGISNFRLPLAIAARDGRALTLETSVTGSVSLEAAKKGINMSRIMRTFYRHADAAFDLDRLDGVLDDYLTDLDSFDARLMLRFRLPLTRRALRSGLEGWQFYDVAWEVIRAEGRATRALHLDYVYSSTCPCSLELAEHARMTRGQIATPHSQRSVARVSAALTGAGPLHAEDLLDHCTAAIPTETQVMVKREDEQAFAELNGSNPIFVEDAVRLICERLEGDARIGDFRVAASHQESLHSHDAVSVLSRGATFAQPSLDPQFFASLHHAG